MVSRKGCRQATHFVVKKSTPDLAAENYEVNLTARATIDDLTELGKRQMAMTT